ncbi:putative leucine-rich repeat receptor-like serine/threonine-protein kinase At2g24130 [Silene latifolia]|uniref:putative leucine-rich repeat receptor-like serine/threonine-protein kinase At2g24130 n=1 Tax=Silene latifolia TaxID=37657 RepID=UPI003D788D59
MGLCKFAIILLYLLPICNATLSNDRLSLLSFMSGIAVDPQGALKLWNSSTVHVCNWTGIACNLNQDRVIKLDLSSRLLMGTISPSLGNLTYLTILDLSDNMFQGRIPPELAAISGLLQVSLAWNRLEGEIPFQLGRLSKLNYLNLGSNKLVGHIPEPLFCNGSSNLEYLDLSNNSLSGEIPMKDGCDLKELTYLLLWSNSLRGNVPRALSNSTNLKWVDLESNNLTGELPSRVLTQMPMLQFVYLSYNDFVSHDGNTNLEPFFASLANASNLQELEIAGNNLGGKLPPIIGKLSTNLVQLHLDDNLLYGPIPPQISHLVNLTLLNLSSNLINGSIPLELCRIKTLERLYLANNSLSGVIPSSFGEIPHLGLLDLSDNKLSGSIPDSFANLPQLRRLLLNSNQLSGQIPPSLGSCINLEILDLSHNQISGKIPGEVAGLSSLKLYLNLSSNYLTGPIPLELSKMEMVLAIDLSMNNLSSTIASQLGNCVALEYLNLSGNHLEGTVPFSLGQLPYLKTFDVSRNQLTGEIPDSFQVSTTLIQLNLSYNQFSGCVPNRGVFSLLNETSFLGNNALCGPIKGLPTCRSRNPSRHIMLWSFVVLAASAVTFLYIFARSLARRPRIRESMEMYKDDKNPESKNHEASEELMIPRISYPQLYEATGGFSPSGLIGSGRFGRVYKGTLKDNTKIAVKVLDCCAKEVSGSFWRECRVLRNTRHRNLTRIITICSKPDFKAIVFPLMSNGSLERHLYPCHGFRQGLDLAQIVSICTDVAEGMAYLHHYSPVRVVHCDLKPSNILLDEDMTALVTDFGISKLVGGDTDTVSSNDSISFSSTDGLLCGSIGYIAPEYGMGKRASTQGDVYSFGVLLLEIVTGKRPTDVLLDEGSNLHEWVKSHYPHNLGPIVEQALLRSAPHSITAEQENKVWRDVLLEMIELGLLCTQYSVSTRPTMLDVAQEMEGLKQYISNPVSESSDGIPHKI